MTNEKEAEYPLQLNGAGNLHPEQRRESLHKLFNFWVRTNSQQKGIYLMIYFLES